jgi:hypothetical protein
MRWASCSTAGALQGVSVYSHGLGTCLDVRCGAIWVFLFEAPRERGRPHFCNIQDFLSTFNNVENANDLNVEAVCLVPGTRL